MNEKRARFEAVVLPHLDAAYRFARWLTGSPADADDVTQEAVLRAFRGFDTQSGPDAKAWLLAIVRNCYFTSRAQAQRRSWVPLPLDDDSAEGELFQAGAFNPEEAAIQSDHTRLIGGLLEALSDDYREILILREIEDMSYRDIAAVTNLPIGTVMSRLARARAALRAQWLMQSRGESHGLY
jgi:RNA polymerase sigma-70 factor (ECF subfamily)